MYATLPFPRINRFNGDLCSVVRVLLYSNLAPE
jgi:hypothetical protein